MVALVLGGFAVSGSAIEFFEHFRDTRKTFSVSDIEHPTNATRGEPVEFVIIAKSSTCFSNPILKIRGNFLTKTVTGRFYWYMEWDHIYCAAEVNFSYNFTLTREFSTTGIWTIDVNGYTTSITIRGSFRQPVFGQLTSMAIPRQ